MTARPIGERLRLVDTRTGEKLLWIEELYAALRAAEARAAEEAAARRAAEELAGEIAARRMAEERVRALTEELARLQAASKPTAP